MKNKGSSAGEQDYYGEAYVNTTSVVRITWEGWNLRSTPHEMSREQARVRLVDVVPDCPVGLSLAWKGSSGMPQRELTHP